MKSIEEYFLENRKLWLESEAFYAEYAAAVGVEHETVQMMYYITILDSCTQADLVKLTRKPRQTVNDIIRRYREQGLIELEYCEQDRRTKTIRLTEKGREFTEAVIEPLNDMETHALADFSDEERAQYIALQKKWFKNLRKELEAGITQIREARENW